MIHGISSLVQGGTRITAARAVLSHVVGGVAGGVGAAAVSWLILTPIRTLVPTSAVAVSLAGLGTVGLLIDAGLLEPPLRMGQVPKSWYSRFGPERSYLAYGLSLGAGIITAAPFAVTYVCFAAAGLAASPLTAAIAGAAFGLGRSVPVGTINLHRRLVSGIDSLFASFQYRFTILSALLCLSIVILALAAMR